MLCAVLCMVLCVVLCVVLCCKACGAVCCAKCCVVCRAVSCVVSCAMGGEGLGVNQVKLINAKKQQPKDNNDKGTITCENRINETSTYTCTLA